MTGGSEHSLSCPVSSDLVMKILLFGGTGQLGYDVIRRAFDLNFEVVSPVTSEVDISDLETVSRFVKSARPDVILNCAAYTAVDAAESHKEQAFLINATGAENIARASGAVGARVLHVSTDYVFDGTAQTPRKETDTPSPTSVYGASKLEGELRVLEVAGERGMVIRTASLYGQRGVNFVATMLKFFQEREEIQVVNDQWMSPTWSGWLAEVLLDLVRMPASGVVHAVCGGSATWYEFAQEIQRFSGAHLPSGAKTRILPTTAAQFARPAPRPRYSVLNCDHLTRFIGRPPIPWREALKEFLKEIGMEHR